MDNCREGVIRMCDRNFFRGNKTRHSYFRAPTSNAAGQRCIRHLKSSPLIGSLLALTVKKKLASCPARGDNTDRTNKRGKDTSKHERGKDRSELYTVDMENSRSWPLLYKEDQLAIIRRTTPVYLSGRNKWISNLPVYCAR